METPVAFIIFNRPQQTKQTFEVIRQAKPSKLLVVADGSRANRPDDIEKCAATRAVIDQVDWECEVLKNFSHENLGCGLRVSTGISWVFENVEEAIILEDDCMPHLTFFRFCEELLERYRFDQRVMNICGCNFNVEKPYSDESYFFSRYPNIWGWATWRRAWNYYDFQMQSWPEVRKTNLLKVLLTDQHSAENWVKTFQAIYDGKVNTWDYQWTLACFLQSGLSILPKTNLVTNIGYGPDATHTPLEDVVTKDIPVEAMTFPLKHPEFIIRDSLTDEYIQDTRFDYHPKFLKRVRSKLSLAVRSRYFKLWESSGKTNI